MNCPTNKKAWWGPNRIKPIPTIRSMTEVKIVFFLPKYWDCIPPNTEPRIIPITIILAN